MYNWQGLTTTLSSGSCQHRGVVGMFTRIVLLVVHLKFTRVLCQNYSEGPTGDAVKGRRSGKQRQLITEDRDYFPWVLPQKLDQRESCLALTGRRKGGNSGISPAIAQRNIRSCSVKEWLKLVFSREKTLAARINRFKERNHLRIHQLSGRFLVRKFQACQHHRRRVADFLSNNTTNFEDKNNFCRSTIEQWKKMCNKSKNLGLSIFKNLLLKFVFFEYLE